MIRIRTLPALCAVLALTGCASMRTESVYKLREAEQAGLPIDAVEKTSALTAGSLNLLPGVGNVYLACTSDHWGNWILFPVNLITWPFSILWGVPQVAIDAHTVNKQATADFYSDDPKGREIFDQAVKAKAAKPAPAP